MSVRLCLNCLSTGARGIPVGHERGHQLDRYHETVDLCPMCEQALIAGDFRTLADRYVEERTVVRGELDS